MDTDRSNDQPPEGARAQEHEGADERSSADTAARPLDEAAVAGHDATSSQRDLDASDTPAAIDNEADDVPTGPSTGGTRAPFARLVRRVGSRPRAAGATVVGVLVVVVAVAGAFAFGPLGSGGQGAPSPAPGSTPTLGPSATFAFGERSVGMSSAPVTIEIWADFQCPFCGLFTHGIEPSLLREDAATGRALITFRDFAFLGQESSDAAVAARCAGAQDQFWRYHDLLFASQRGENEGAFSRDVLLGLARFAKLDEAAFATCLDDPAIAAAVRSETVIGRQLGIASTPSLRIVGPHGAAIMSGVVDPAAIAAAVARGGAPAPTPVPGASTGTASPARSPGSTDDSRETQASPSGDPSPTP